MDDAPGRLVGGRYRLTSPLGRGGMGTVWAGHDEVLHRDVAVKEVLLPPQLTDEQRAELRERTLREARAAARVNAGAAVTVFDVVEEDDRPWIVMQRLPARSLADVLRESGPLAPEQARRVGLRLLEALTAAHAAGVLHRDVKPANVMLDDEGQAYLTDFGIATLEGDPAMTATGILVGSPAYVAPERARGERPTRAADLWSLGATLYTAVEGRSPFERQGPLPTLAAVLGEEPRPPVRAGALEPVIMGLLHKDPAERLDAAAARRLLQSPPPAAAAPRPAAPPAPVRPDEQVARTQAVPLPPVTPAAGAAAASRPGTTQPDTPQQDIPRQDTPAPEPEPTPTVPASGRHVGRRRLRVALPLTLVAVLAAALVTYLGVRALGDDPPTADAPNRSATSATPTGGPTDAAPTEPGPTDAAPTDPGPTDIAPSAPADATGAPAESPGATSPAAPTPSEPAGDDDDGGDDGGQGEGGSGGGAAAAVPAGYEVYDDTDGFEVAVPEGWTVQQRGPQTRFIDPDSRRYLMVERGGEPNGDPLEDWQNQEGGVAQRLDGYERISIERVDYRDYDAADWQFTWRASGGPLRVINRNVVADGRAFAIYWSAPPEGWDEGREVFDVATRTFRPA